MEILTFNKNYQIQHHTFEGTGTAVFERDATIRGFFIDNPASGTALVEYYPNLLKSTTHKVDLINETSTSAVVASGVPALDSNRAQLVFELSANVVMTIYYSLPHIGF